RPIVVHGDVDTIDISHGQLYGDFRIDQRLVNSLIIGAVVDKPGNSLVGTGSLIAFGRIENVTISGDFGGQIISYSGGIGSVTINNGSLLPAASVQAFAGDLVHLTINNGNLYGSVHADRILWDITLNGSNEFGDMGINSSRSQGNSTSDP